MAWNVHKQALLRWHIEKRDRRPQYYSSWQSFVKDVFWCLEVKGSKQDFFVHCQVVSHSNYDVLRDLMKKAGGAINPSMLQGSKLVVSPGMLSHWPKGWPNSGNTLGPLPAELSWREFCREESKWDV